MDLESYGTKKDLGRLLKKWQHRAHLGMAGGIGPGVRGEQGGACGVQGVVDNQFLRGPNLSVTVRTGLGVWRAAELGARQEAGKKWQESLAWASRVGKQQQE